MKNPQLIFSMVKDWKLSPKKRNKRCLFSQLVFTAALEIQARAIEARQRNRRHSNMNAVKLSPNPENKKIQICVCIYKYKHTHKKFQRICTYKNA